MKDADEVVIAPYLEMNSTAFEALRLWARQHGEGEIKSEASALRALLQAGVQVVRDHALEAGYAQLAQEFNAEPAHKDRRAARDRYTARTEARL